MMDIAVKEEQILSGLKDFQRATVERIFKLFGEGKSRVLVADEVGLGKTLIAKGVIAKTAKYHREVLNDNLFKVVYVCSNQNIAGQNLKKLKINDTDRIDSLSETRLSMQHLRIYEDRANAKKHKHFIQLIPLTPNTSFNITNGGGSVRERALIYAIITRYDRLKPYQEQLNNILEYYATSSWPYAKKDMCDKVDQCNKDNEGKYLPKMLSEVDQYFITQPDTLSEVIDLCEGVRQGEVSEGASRIIYKLRRMMAEISVELLDADLVIMDEFQRFPELINREQDSETGILAGKFLGGVSRQEKRVKVLLLSATPYKLYSTLEEMSEKQQDEHYREFTQVVNFLFENNTNLKAEFKEAWNDYSGALLEIGTCDIAVLEAKKIRAEDALYQGISRTERLTVQGAGQFVDTSKGNEEMSINEGDVLSYIQADQLLQEIGLNEQVPVDYVKSSPYLLSFMDHYKMKEKVVNYFKKNPIQLPIANKTALWLPESLVNRYEPLPDRNARVAQLKREAMPAGAEKLLWIPPCKPYYEGGGPFASVGHFSKMLVFSSWEMVPRSIAALLSYESERLTIGKLVKQTSSGDKANRKYFTTKNKTRFPAPRLKFNMRDGMPGAMTLLSLLYPSVTLARLYNPIEAMNQGLNRRQIEQLLHEKIENLLNSIQYTQIRTEGAPDDRWYTLAPVLMDLEEAGIRDWLSQPHPLWHFVSKDVDQEEDPDDQDDLSPMEKHIEELRQAFKNGGLTELGRQPRDLVNVLVKMAMGSPAVCAMRLFGIEGDNSPALSARLAKTIIDRFNLQESTAIVELSYNVGGSSDSHWQNVLRYCVDGNLQSMLDEYAHILIEENGWVYSTKEVRAQWVCQRVVSAFKTKTASYNVDTYRNFSNRVLKSINKDEVRRMRSGYAAGFYDVKETDQSIQRKGKLREAFNSPLRPFVLATTSIGQEGLDFHFYCRKVVHWNLPSNPVDLEQREGRINRYKCLAIRQNIANKFGSIPFVTDPWSEMFEAANQAEKKEGQPELVPYWCLPDKFNIKIERIVPMYPLSREQSKYKRLIKILSLYRLSMGQARQEELLEYVLRSDLGEDQLQTLFMNLSPFFKENVSSLVLSK